jgi:23S rRNA (cytidine1920-2'-O)/16S rRNA (cytidine1409-2'-O)-methyltransferase
MDVSFISQTLIHKGLSDVLNEGALFISLIKPQFESGRSALGKNGIVKNAKDRENAIKRVLESALINSFEPVDLIKSPIEGGDGNLEYLACFIKKEGSIAENKIDAKYITAISRN